VAWISEPYNFTPWLAQADNLSLLSEAVGIELELVQQEAGVGAFSADILAKDTNSDSFVVIENQLEQTDHSHLGQLITYASGLDASAIIWISRKVREEHRQAMDWLNALTPATTGFFAIEVELWQIEESPLAPKFNVVARPNTFQKNTHQAQEASVGASGQVYLAYFGALFEYLAEHAPTIKTMAPQPQTWTNISLGRSNYNLRVMAGIQKKNLIVDFVSYLDSEKTIADFVLAREDVIRALIPNAIFNRKEGRKESTVEVHHKADIQDRGDWPNQFAWISQALLSFDAVFRPMVKELP
jgi:hypothetical protein